MSFNLCVESHLWCHIKLKIVAFSCCIPYLFSHFIYTYVIIYIYNFYTYIHIYSFYSIDKVYLSIYKALFNVFWKISPNLSIKLLYIFCYIYSRKFYVWCYYILNLKQWISWNISSFYCTYCYIKYVFGLVLSSYFVLFSPTFSMSLLSFFLAFS